MKKSASRPLPNYFSQAVSAPVLLSQARRAFEKIPDPRRYGQQFSLPDVLMSGLAVFGLKYPSLLKFDEQRHAARIRANLKSFTRLSTRPATPNCGRCWTGWIPLLSAPLSCTFISDSISKAV